MIFLVSVIFVSILTHTHNDFSSVIYSILYINKIFYFNLVLSNGGEVFCFKFNCTKRKLTLPLFYYYNSMFSFISFISSVRKLV